MNTGNGKIGWFESGNAQKNWEYTGEILEGKPNGKGTLISPFENYSGEFKNGKMHGQITILCGDHQLQALGIRMVTE